MRGRSAPDKGAPTSPLDLAERDERTFDRKLIAMLAGFARPHWKSLCAAVALLPLVTLAQVGQPFAVQQAIDGPIAEGDPRGLWKYGAMFLSLILFDFVFRLLQTALMERKGQRIVHEIRLKLFDHLLRLNLSFYEKSRAGKLITRVTNDLEGLAELFSAGLIPMIQDIFMLAGIVAAMVYIDLKLTLVTFLVVPPLFVLAYVFRVKMRDVFLTIRKQIAGINADMQENLNGIETVKLFAAERRNAQRFDALNAEYRDTYKRYIVMDAGLFAIVEFFSAVSIALFIWYGAGRAVSGAVTFGSLVAFVELVQKFFIPIRDISAKYSIIQSAFTSADRIHNLLETQSFIDEPQRPQRPDRIRGEIEFDNVSFHYGNGDPALDGISFKIRPGETAAFVGATGAGKSTILKLLSRFYDPQQGAIRIDGVDLRDFDKKTLRANIGQVLQDVFLFGGTVAENIALDGETTREEVERLGRIAQVDRVTSHTSEGYGLEVLERGANLSFGEKQLIAFARVLAKDPPILALDEATSNIDAATESLIQRGLVEITKGRTNLIIAHRLSTITHADRIFVLHHGKIIEEGDHPSLMADMGAYWRLVQLQFQKENAAWGMPSGR